MKKSRKKALKNLAADMDSGYSRNPQQSSAVQSIVNICLTVQNENKRQKAINQIVTKSEEVRKLLSENPELIKTEVEQALIRAATGYEVTEKKVKISGGRKSVETITKTIPPNPAALEFFLTNKAGNEYSKNPIVKNEEGNGKINEILEALKDVR